MGEVLITRKSQRGGVPPDGFTQPTQILTESGTWTCPRSGTYRVTCIGAGGQSICGGSQSGGGGAGGIAESILPIQKGSNYILTLDSAVTSFGNLLSTNAGSNASDSIINGAYSVYSGTGGGASGGNIGNYQGGDGKYYLSNDSYTKIIGGDTNSSSKYGGISGGVISVKFIKATYEDFTEITQFNPVSCNNKLPFGAGGWQTSDYDARYPKTFKSAAIIIEYLK